MDIQLPVTIERRLKNLARRTKRSESYYVRRAVLRYLQDLEDAEDIRSAERVLDRINKGLEKTIPLEEIMQRHGVTTRRAKARRLHKHPG